VEAFTRGAAAAFGGIGTCLANAGIVERGALVELPPDRWRRQIEVNLTGCFLTATAAARIMQEGGAGGRILFVGSWVQDVPRAGIGAYCVSKSGLEMLARCLALELGNSGIRVNVIAPGFVDAGLTGENLRRYPEKRPGMEAEVPLGRLASAEEVARAALLLCSAEADYITGTTLLVDGGASLHRKA
jgi:NAD(P)-dependent dehydrogenase (short-subunit alcohol dehydrogenase family)